MKPGIVCPHINLIPEVIAAVNRFETDEQFLRAGGLSSELLDKLAYGFSDEEIKTLNADQLHIKWKEDYANVKWEQERSGLSKVAWAKTINLSEPIDVSYEKFKFYVEDGHHRTYAAKILKKPLNVNLEIKMNPVAHLAPNLGYDDLMRCIFKQGKEMKLNEQLSRIKNMMGINEEEIQITQEPGTMLFFHGGDLDDINADYQQKSSNQKYGAGLYLITKYEVAMKYAKGSRKFYLVSVKPGTDLNDKTFTLDQVMQFLNTTFSKPTVQKIVGWLNYRPLQNNQVPAYLINNILINHELLKPKISNAWKSFLIQNGVDYELVDNPFGWGETMMVLYNMDLIKNVRRIQGKDRLSTYDLKKIS